MGINLRDPLLQVCKNGSCKLKSTSRCSLQNIEIATADMQLLISKGYGQKLFMIRGIQYWSTKSW